MIYKRHRCIIIQLAWKIDESSVTPDSSHDRARTFALSDIKAKVNQNTASEFPKTKYQRTGGIYRNIITPSYLQYTSSTQKYTLSNSKSLKVTQFISLFN